MAERARMRTIAARHYHVGRLAPIRVVVIHTAEAAETPGMAENVARYFATTSNQVSAHVCVDNVSRIRCLPDRDTAWAAPGCNADGLQLELVGFARQTAAQWTDDYSRAALANAADQVAEWCRLHGIPARWLSRADLRAGKKGLTTHADVSAVYRRSDHGDPGPHFPAARFLALVKQRLGGDAPAAPERDVPAAPAWPGRVLRVISPYMSGQDVRQWQRRMRARGWSIAVDGVYGPASRRVCVAFQVEKLLRPDGMVGPLTWAAAWTAPVT